MSLCVFVFLSGSFLWALVVGSYTTPSRNTTLVTFPAGAANIALGFGTIEAGFTLASNTTTCTYAGYFPVSGPVNFTGGQLYLDKDLPFGNVFSLGSAGFIRGNDKSLIFPSYSSALSLPSSGTMIFDEVTLVFNSDVVVNNNWRLRGVCVIMGGGTELTLLGNARIELAPGAQVTFQNLTINNLGGYNLRCLSDASMTLDNVTLNLSRDYTFSQGSLVFQRDVVLSGTSFFIYTSASQSTIASQSTLYFDNGVSFSYAPTIASKSLLSFTDISSGLYLNGTSVYATCTGLSLQTGMLFLDNNVTLSNQARNSGEATEFSSSLNIQALAGSVLDIFGIVKYV